MSSHMASAVRIVPLLLSVAGFVGAGLAPAQSILTGGNAPSGEPPGDDFVQIASKFLHSAARRTDGTLAVWGDNSHGQCNQPPLPSGLTYVHVSTGERHTVALRSDGAMIGFGNNLSGQCAPPPLPGGVTLRDVDASNDWNLGLCSDGRVVVWGAVAGPLAVAPGGDDFVAIAAGSAHALALRSDGTIAAWGDNYFGQLAVPPLPAGLAYTAVAAGSTHSVALRSDGQVVTTYFPFGTSNPLPPLGPGQRWVRIATGYWQTVAWRSDGEAFLTGSYWYYFTPLPAGQACVDVAWGYQHVHRLVTPTIAASFDLLGPGCAGSLGTSHLTAAAMPTLGSTFTTAVAAVPAGLAVLLSGLDASNSPFGPLPVDLTPLGMTGCLGYVRTDVIQVALSSAGVASFELQIPWRPVLFGLEFYQQALLPDPGVNPAGLVLSDAMHGRVGF